MSRLQKAKTKKKNVNDDSESEDDNPEMATARREFFEVLHRKWLTDHGFNADDVNQPRTRFPCDSPMHVAVFERNLAVIKYLHKRGASLTATNLNGDGPLQNAAASTPPDLAFWFNKHAEVQTGAAFSAFGGK